jgi:hypothetical protein
MQEITRVRALCCQCGNLRTVSAKYSPRNDDNRSGECDGDPRSWARDRHAQMLRLR